MLDMKEDMSKILTFKEEESKKMDAVKELLKSKFFIAFMVTYLVYVVACVVYMVYSTVTIQAMSGTSTAQLVLDIAIELLIPFVLIRFLYIFRLVSLGKSKDKYGSSVLNRLALLRKFIQFYFLIFGIFTLIEGLSFLNIDAMYAANQDYFAQTGITEEMVKAYKTASDYFIFDGVFKIFIVFLFNSFFRSVCNGVVFDKKKAPYPEVIALAIGFFVYGSARLVGAIISSFGIDNPLCQAPLNLTDGTDIIYLITVIIYSIFYFMAGTFILLIRNKLVNNEGTNSILDSLDTVYTVSVDDINEEK